MALEAALARPFSCQRLRLLDLQHFGGWHLIQHQANFDSPGGLVGGDIIRLTVPYALGSVGAGVLFATIFGISAIYLFNVNPVMTVLNAFSWYREWNDPQRGRAAGQGAAAGAARSAGKPAHPASKIEELQKQGRAGASIAPEPSNRAAARSPSAGPRTTSRTRRAAGTADPRA